MALVVAAILTGCSHTPSPPTAPKVSPNGQEVNLILANRGPAPVTLSLDLDGKAVYRGALKPQSRRKLPPIPLARSWHRLTTTPEGTEPHVTMFSSAGDRWILIESAPSRSEKVRVHVSEVPIP